MNLMHIKNQCEDVMLTNFTYCLDTHNANSPRFWRRELGAISRWIHSYAISMVLFTHEAFFITNLLWFFCSRPLFIVRFLLCRVIFHVQTGWALLFVLQLIALLFVFPIDNRYEYILMHFKGLTDLVNSTT